MVPPLQVKYDQNGDLVLDEKRDYLGNLVSSGGPCKSGPGPGHTHAAIFPGRPLPSTLHPGGPIGVLTSKITNSSTLNPSLNPIPERAKWCACVKNTNIVLPVRICIYVRSL